MLPSIFGRNGLFVCLFLVLGMGTGFGQVTVEFSQATGSDAEDVGGNLPQLTVSGLLLLTDRYVTVNDSGTGTAINGDDYIFANPVIVTIPSGSYVVPTNIVIPGLSIETDSDIELDESINFTLSDPDTNVSLGVQSTTSYTILNDEFVDISIDSPASVLEENTGTSQIDFTISIDQSDPLNDITVDYLISGGNEDTDTGTLTFLAGTTTLTQTVSVTTNGDTVVEPDEPVSVTLSNASTNGNISTAVGNSSFTDDDSATLTITDVSAAEDVAGGNLVFSVTLDNAVALGTEVTYTFTDGTATGGGTDYDSTGGTLNFTGTASEVQQITVPITNDAIVEGIETFTVALGTPTNGVGVSGSPATGTITDDDSATLTIADVSAAEDVAGGNLVFSVTLDNAVALGTDVTYTFTDGTATGGGTDYDSTGGTLNFTGTASEVQQITVPITNDAIVEGIETFTVALGTPTNGVGVSGSPATGTITDDDGATLTIADVSVAEDVAGGNLVFSVTLDNAVALGTDVTYTFTDGTATGGGTDYDSTGGTLNFTGTASEVQQITVPITNDAIVEGIETFTVALGTPTNGVGVSGSPATGTITDDDGATLTIADVSVAEDVAGGNLVFSVTLDNAVALGTEVTYTFTDGTATGGGTDYDSTGGTLNFTGTASEVQQITVPITNDAIVEGIETFTVALGTPTNGVGVSGSPATGTIIDDDSASVTIADASGDEDSGAITVSATLNNAVAGGFTVDVSTVDGTATTTDSDYTPITGQTLEFNGNAGEVQTFEVIPTVDAKIETNESLTITMDNLADTVFVVDISDTATIIINNDDSCRAGTTAPTLNSTGTAFCDAFNQDLDLYVSDVAPTGAELRWSTNSDILVSGDYLSSSVVNTPGTYYGFFYDAINDCFSDATEVILTQSFTPTTGVASNLGTCSDAGDGDTLVDLDSSLSGADPGDWVLLTAPAGASISINTENIINFDGQPEGDYTFRYTTTGATGTCSNQSVDITVTVNDCSGPCDAGNTAPQFNGTDTTIEFCDVVNADLSSYVTGTPPAGTELTWSTSNDPSETGAHLNNPNVVAPGTYYGFYYDSDNNCGSPVLAITLVRNFTPTIDSTSGDSSCGPSILTLTASASVDDDSTISYTWYDAPTGGTIVGTSGTFTTNTLTETTSFYVTAAANGCETERVEVVATIYNELSAGIPIEDLTVCNVSSDEGPTTFDLDDGLMGQDAGTWTVITDPSNGEATLDAENIVDFTDLPSGAYVFEYTTQPVGDCTETSSAQLTITVQDCISNESIDLAITKEVDDNEVLLDDEVRFTITVENMTTDIVQDIVVSDLLEDGFEFLSSDSSEGSYDDTTGEWTIDELVGEESATLIIRARVTEAGTLTNTATLSSSLPIDDNPENDTATVEVKVNRSQCEDPGTLCNIFSPDGDGKNDTLTLVDHTSYPNNSLEIFDRYGNSVFQMDGYDSSWDGTGKDGDLPNGTYFYILDLNGDGTDVVKGWIQIVR